MFLRVILFLLALYLFIGILKQLFQVKNKVEITKNTNNSKNRKNISKIFEAEDITFEEIDKNEK